MTRQFKAGLMLLAPVLATLAVSALCAVLIGVSALVPVSVTPFEEGAVGSFGNALYFVVLVAVGATILYLLLKRRSHRLIAVITGFALTTAVFMLSLVYLLAVFSLIEVPYSLEIVLVLSVVFVVLADYVIFKNKQTASNAIVIVLGGALGAFLGFSIPAESAALILGFLAVYDAFAVYRGPVGKIAQGGLEQLRGLSFSFKDVQMGLGDLTFYSLLSANMFLYFGVFSCAASVVGILVGCFLSFKMLEKRGMFPGLPFPVLFGLAAGYLTFLLI